MFELRAAALCNWDVHVETELLKRPRCLLAWPGTEKTYKAKMQEVSTMQPNSSLRKRSFLLIFGLRPQVRHMPAKSRRNGLQ